MSLINEAPKRIHNASPNAAVPPPSVSNYRIQSKVESTGAKGNFLATVLVAGVVLVGLIVLGSRIAKHVQSVQDGFTSNTDASVSDAPAVETKPTQPAAKPATELVPMP
jgi:hypothetical protein